jgi:hypothetical protein
VCGVIAAGAALVIACGSFGSSGSSTKPLGDGAATPEPPEERLLTFPCSTTNCIAGEQACCQIAATFSCFGIEAGGCPYGAGSDGGAGPDGGPSAPPLFCTSYLNCSLGEQCCYRADLGSSCQNNCPNGSDSLCTLARDRCDSYTDCVPLTNPPQAGIGACTYSGGTSGNTSGGTSGWH